METKDFRKVLEDAEDKFNAFADPEVLNKYEFTIAEFIAVIKEFLSDEEKQRLFGLEHISAQSPYIKSKILDTIADDNIKMEVMETVDIGLDRYSAMDVIKKFGDEAKLQVLHRADFRDRFSLENYDIGNIAKSLSEGNIISLLSDIDFVSGELDLMPNQIVDLISKIASEDKRLELADIHMKSEKSKFNKFYVRDIVIPLSTEKKVSVITDNRYGIDNAELVCIIAALSIPELVSFLNGNKKFLEDNGISPHNVTSLVREENQAEIVARIDELDFDDREKRLVLVLLKNKVKAEVDMSSIPEEYRKALSMQRGENLGEGTFGKIIVDLSRDLEDYRDFDEYIVINPKKLSEEERQKLFELCEICPKMAITDDLGLTPSTAEEYINGEAWITQVLEGIDPNWSDIQKVAYVDNQIGRRISYTPDFETEECDAEAARALWKIIDSGYGVCNGIAQVEGYILGRLRNRS